MPVLTAVLTVCDSALILVAGHQCQNVAQEASRLEGVEKILDTDASFYEHILAEDLAALILKIAADFRYILAPATTFGKNFLPRVAALLDVAQVSDVVEIISPNTFVRPIYAGNAYQVVELPIRFL